MPDRFKDPDYFKVDPDYEAAFTSRAAKSAKNSTAEYEARMISEAQLERRKRADAAASRNASKGLMGRVGRAVEGRDSLAEAAAKYDAIADNAHKSMQSNMILRRNSQLNAKFYDEQARKAAANATLSRAKKSKSPTASKSPSKY